MRSSGTFCCNPIVGWLDGIAVKRLVGTALRNYVSVHAASYWRVRGATGFAEAQLGLIRGPLVQRGPTRHVLTAI